MKKSKKQPKQSTTKQYVKLILLVALAGLMFASLTSFLANPTKQHRDISRDQVELSDKRAKLDKPDSREAKDYDKKLEDLSKTPEHKYTESVNSVLGFWGSLAFSVVVIGVVYNYIRRQKIAPTGRAAIATALVNTAGSFAAVLPWLPIDWWLRGSPSFGVDASAVGIIAAIGLVVLPIGFLISFFWTYVVSLIFEFFYNRQNGSTKTNKKSGRKS